MSPCDCCGQVAACIEDHAPGCEKAAVARSMIEMFMRMPWEGFKAMADLMIRVSQ